MSASRSRQDIIPYPVLSISRIPHPASSLCPIPHPAKPIDAIILPAHVIPAQYTETTLCQEYKAGARTDQDLLHGTGLIEAACLTCRTGVNFCAFQASAKVSAEHEASEERESRATGLGREKNKLASNPSRVTRAPRSPRARLRSLERQAKLRLFCGLP